jgi:hypothetical protein
MWDEAVINLTSMPDSEWHGFPGRLEILYPQHTGVGRICRKKPYIRSLCFHPKVLQYLKAAESIRRVLGNYSPRKKIRNVNAAAPGGRGINQFQLGGAM